MSFLPGRAQAPAGCPQRTRACAGLRRETRGRGGNPGPVPHSHCQVWKSGNGGAPVVMAFCKGFSHEVPKYRGQKSHQAQPYSAGQSFVLSVPPP